MIDLHSHVLPQMDDGSANPQETATLLDMLGRQGVTTVVATPHYYATRETPEEFLQRRQDAVTRMLPATAHQPNLLLGAEIAYFSGLGVCEEIIPLRIADSKLLLIEMPFYSWSNSLVDEICQIPGRLGLIPVLAHINRYNHSDQFPRYRQLLAESGVLFQCNAEAFHGILHRRWALDMLKQGYIHFLGSDCHNLSNRAPALDQARKVIEKKLGAVFLIRMDNAIHEILYPGEK